MNAPSNPSPYRHPSAKSVRMNATGSDPAITPNTPQDPTKSTAYLARRLHLALHDLGVLHVPPEWMQATPESISFRSLSVREADTFVLSLEDVVLARTASEPPVNPDQLRLF